MWLSERAASVIRTSADRSHPTETGGILLGVYTADRRPWIVEAVHVKPAAAHGTYYELPPDARPLAVDAARRHDRRLGYLGDWHSHPADVGPSSLDKQTMCDVAADRGAACPHPVLLIARRTGDGEYRLDGRQVAVHHLRRVRLIAAGGLPEPGTTAGTGSTFTAWV